MNAISPAAYKQADPALLAALCDLEDGGHADIPYTDLAETLDRARQNVHRSIKNLEKSQLLSLKPLRVSDQARNLVRAWNGESVTPSIATPISDGVVGIPHNQIDPSPLNPRKTFEAEALVELADAIADKGLLQNIVVRPKPGTTDRFEIAAGERRWRAFGLLIDRGDLPADTPVRALVEEMTDQELLLVALAENRDRLDPPPMEEAQGIETFRELRIKQILAEIYDGDPLEKGFTQDQIAQEERMAIGTAMKEAAAAMGKTTRWVELRLKLATGLAPELQEALTVGEVSLAQARVLCTAPAERQISALEAIQSGWYGWDTAEGLREHLRSEGLPVSEAKFDRSDYTGETMVDPETDEEILLDAAEITSLSMAAIELRKKELEAEGVAFVKVFDDPSKWWKYTEIHDGKPGPDNGVLLFVNRLRIVEKVVAIPEKGPDAAVKAKSEDGKKEVTIQPYAKRHWFAACEDRTRRMRTAIAASDIRISIAITVLALMPRELTMSSWDQPYSWISQPNYSGLDRDVRIFPGLAAALADLEKDGEPAGFKIKAPAAIVSNGKKAFDTLINSAPEKVTAVFQALIAQQAGAWPGYDPKPGCNPLLEHIAAALEPNMPAFEMSADYLANFTTAQRAQIARACGLAGDLENLPKGKAAAIEWILEHPDRNQDWCPPEMQFASPAKVEKNVKALLEGKAS